ncbi:hypothetical protein JHK82_049740 [Glycine max]|nr:hypothetical protein JHK85_050356 [Glycine max]KAG5090962.1 hypothetical protein JHK82_049740 [Glycine max]
MLKAMVVDMICIRGYCFNNLQVVSVQESKGKVLITTPTSGEGAEKMDAEDGVNCSDYEHDIENEDLWDGNEESGGYWSGIYDRNKAHTKPLLMKGTNTTSQIAIVCANLCPIESLDYE